MEHVESKKIPLQQYLAFFVPRRFTNFNCKQKHAQSEAPCARSPGPPTIALFSIECYPSHGADGCRRSDHRSFCTRTRPPANIRQMWCSAPRFPPKDARPGAHRSDRTAADSRRKDMIQPNFLKRKTRWKDFLFWCPFVPILTLCLRKQKSCTKMFAQREFFRWAKFLRPTSYVLSALFLNKNAKLAGDLQLPDKYEIQQNLRVYMMRLSFYLKVQYFAQSRKL